jgi:hypothetical protein
MSYQKRILGQQLGAYVYRDPRIVIANHDLAQVSGTFWTTDRSSAEGNSISDLKLSLPAGEKNQTIFWGDGTSGSFTANSSTSTTTTTTGAVTETVNPAESARTRSGTHLDNPSYRNSALDANVAGWWMSPYAASDFTNETGWLQIDLGEDKTVSGVVTQPSIFSPTYCITKYKVRYSTDGSNFAYVDSGAEFTGNSGTGMTNTKVSSTFATPVTARYIRIYPKATYVLPLMRAGLLVNTGGTTTTTITVDGGNALSHTWPASLALGTGEALFTSGTLTHTTNTYMSGNYVRGSSNFYAKLI